MSAEAELDLPRESFMMWTLVLALLVWIALASNLPHLFPCS